MSTEGTVTASGSFFCTPCAVDMYFTCSYCTQKRDREQLWTKIEGEGAICIGCRHNYEMENSPPPICNYSYKPRARFRGTSSSKLFFGFELEVERKPRSAGDPPRRYSNEDVAVSIRNAVVDEKGKPFLYIKSDGSICDGFEIVSHPFSWSWFLANSKRLDPIFDLVKRGYLSHDSGRCGMHVHLSKEAFSPLHLYKFLHFFQREKEFITAISQRGNDTGSYAKIAYGPGESIKHLAKEKGGHDGRYQAVNLLPSHTAEIRIFRGTLKKERFMKNMEFCQALYEYTLINSMVNIKLEYFIGFVNRYKNEFPNLFAFLGEKYKFTILKKNLKRRKGGPREAIRYSGPKVGALEPDVLDEHWEKVVEKKAATREAFIAERISSSKKTKEAAIR